MQRRGLGILDHSVTNVECKSPRLLLFCCRLFFTSPPVCNAFCANLNALAVFTSILKLHHLGIFSIADGELQQAVILSLGVCVCVCVYPQCSSVYF